ncbi:hypothetical protein THTE_0644 [Thermogutta terrifontis]|uniref:Uncharacterized protein n=1 Tax=Thermogutta terrifontis TaxID=1331910 RepID=A0A286RBA7_9BACT|nr:hypothetical protein THTE_0644 [Thermogutta terrifontis]
MQVLCPHDLPDFLNIRCAYPPTHSVGRAGFARIATSGDYSR